MKKIKILAWHLGVFVFGSIGIVAYVFIRLSAPTSNMGLGGVIAMPAIALVYVIVFGALCAISLLVWFLVAFFRERK